MSTGAIIAIVVAVLIIIALLVLLPRMRAKAAERKREQERIEAERRLERERREAAEHHRSASETQLKQAELAESEAKKQRAEAEIHAKRAELHEEGLADEELESGSANGRVSPRDLEERGRGEERDSVRPISGGRAHEPVRDEPVRDVERDPAADTGVRDVEREPAADTGEVRSPSDGGDKEYVGGVEGDVQSTDTGQTGARRLTRIDEPDSGDDRDRGPLR